MTRGSGCDGASRTSSPCSAIQAWERPLSRTRSCRPVRWRGRRLRRSEEHTSELQSQSNLVCRLLLEKKNTSELQSPSELACRLLIEKKNDYSDLRVAR